MAEVGLAEEGKDQGGSGIHAGAEPEAELAEDYAGGQRIAMRVGSSTVYYLLTDHLGSTAVTANSGGGKVAELRYDAWGETRYTWGATPTGLRFTGQRLESNVGLYQMGARWYDPYTGRWTSADSVVPDPSNPQSLNRYSYVYNNPLRYTDPTGHQNEEPPPGISEEQHQRLLALRAKALELRDLVQRGQVTDVEALAIMLDLAAGLHTYATYSGDLVDWQGVIADLGLVLGGVRFASENIWRPGSWTDPDAWFELTHRSDHPLNQYYVPGFGSSGFLEDYAGDNQVRHFIGGLVGSATPFSAGQVVLRNREDRGSADYLLNEKAFELYHEMAVDTEDLPYGGAPLRASEWVYSNLATDQVRSMHSPQPPPSTCLGSFLPAYLLGFFFATSMVCWAVARSKRKEKRRDDSVSVRRGLSRKKRAPLVFALIALLLMGCGNPTPWSWKHEKDVSLKQVQSWAPFEVCLPSWLPPEVSAVPTLTYLEEKEDPNLPPLEAQLYAEWYFGTREDRAVQFRQEQYRPIGEPVPRPTWVVPTPTRAPDGRARLLVLWLVGADQEEADAVEPLVTWASSTHLAQGSTYQAVEITEPVEWRGTLVEWNSGDVRFSLYSRLPLAPALDVAKSLVCGEDMDAETP